MAQLSIAERYRPARLLDGKEAMIIYWVWDPMKGKRVRVKEKVNHIRSGRAAWVAQRVRELNGKLALGWNPIIERIAPKAATTMAIAIDEFLAAKLRDELSEDSIRSYKSLCGILSRWLEKKHLSELAAGHFSDEHAVRFMDEQWATGDISRRTYNNYLAFYGTLASWLIKHKYIRDNPFANITRKPVNKRKKNRRPLTGEERVIVRAYLQDHMPRFLEFSLLMFHCALRPKEAFLLKPKNIDLQKGCVLVDESIAKTNNERVVAIPDVFMPMVLALGIESQDPDHYIFSEDFMPGPMRKDSRYSGKWWKKLRTETGLPPEAKHYSLRDTAILQLARDQISRLDSQNHFGHLSSEMHDVYGRHAEAAGNEEVRKRATAF